MSFKTISHVTFRVHLKKAHNEGVTKAKREAAVCFLQRCALLKSGFPYWYWLVPAPSAEQEEKGEVRQQGSGEKGLESLEAPGDPELDALLRMEIGGGGALGWHWTKRHDYS